jgi:CubicO group peptidase (beta-lactamase class C family)
MSTLAAVIDAPLTGTVAGRFAPVREVLADLLATGAETGAALAVIHRGEVAVDLCAGWRDAARTRPWTPDTLVNVFSVSKAVAAVGLLVAVDRGLIGLDDPVVRAWPEYGTHGKDATTVRQVLSHAAGQPDFPVQRSVDVVGDWDLLVTDLANGVPEWPPGTEVAEHAMTYGHLVGEIARRLTGKGFGAYIRDELTAPWRLDLALGLTAEDQARCAELEYATPDWPDRIAGEPGSLRARALANPAGRMELAVLNGEAWRSAEVPAVNMHATALAMARFYAGLAAGGALDGVRLLGEALTAEIGTSQAAGHDLLLDVHVAWGLGVQVEPDGSWGMGGIGGSLAYAHPGLDYTFAYVTRRLGDHGRADALFEAVESCL